MRIDATVSPPDCVAQSNRGQTCGGLSAAMLPTDVFATVVANAPLVAIDLIVEDPQGGILLGLRNNPPAQHYWFVPGGRVRKNETLDAAFARIAHDELGFAADRNDHQSAGVHEHFYDTNFSGAEHASTHYVVLAYRLRIDPLLSRLPREQHSRFQWMRPDQVLQHPDVHPYTKAYFKLTLP